MAEADAETRLEGLQEVPTSAAFILATICLMVTAPIIIITGSYRSSEKTNDTKTIFSHVPRLNITTRLATLFAIFKVMGLIHTIVDNSFMTVLISVSLAAFLIRFCSYFEFGNLLVQFGFHCFQPLFDAYHNGYHQNGAIKNSLFQLSLTRISRHSSNYRRAPSVIDLTFSKLQLCLLTIVFMDRLSMVLEWRHGLLLFFIECLIFIVPIMFMAPAVSFITGKLFPDAFPSARRYHLQIRRRERRSEHHHHKIIIDCTMDKVCKELLAVALCVAVAVWNIEATNQNWISKNMIGMASMATCIELLHLKSIYPGCILLGTVITEEVIQVLLIATMPRLLGILDILIPGIFMAFLLRFDRSLDRNSYNVYFYSSFCAYIAGLMITAITVFMYQQPTILYSLPYCVLVPVLVAYVKGDLSLMFRFRSEANAEADRQCNGMEDNTTVKDQ